MNNLNASTVANNHISRPGPPTVRKVTLILPAYNEDVSTGSITLLSKQHAGPVIVVDEGSTDRTAEVAELAGAEIIIKPQIHSPPVELSACYARGRAGNADERRYIKLPSVFSCVHSRLIRIIHNSRDFLLFPGTVYSHRVHRVHREHRENNTALCVSVFSVVDLLYNDPFILLDQNKLKILYFNGAGEPGRGI